MHSRYSRDSMPVRIARILPLIGAAPILCSASAVAQAVSGIHGGEMLPLRGGVLFSLRGCLASPATPDLSETEILHLLYAVPHIGRGEEWSGGGSDAQYLVTAAFRTADGGTVVADTVTVFDGVRVQIGGTTFDLAAGTLFVMQVMEGPDSIRQVAVEFAPDADIPARLAAIQEALPGDSVVQAMAPRYESYGPSQRGLTSVCRRRARTRR